ncbi:mitogen-activated protein kinase kinase [Malassezia sp. CBS 17886]|nr:mitogen-activated protein kinase kinase [Malassezia sp. CBS 17886]
MSHDALTPRRKTRNFKGLLLKDTGPTARDGLAAVGGSRVRHAGAGDAAASPVPECVSAAGYALRDSPQVERAARLAPHIYCSPMTPPQPSNDSASTLSAATHYLASPHDAADDPAWGAARFPSRPSTGLAPHPPLSGHDELSQRISDMELSGAPNRSTQLDIHNEDLRTVSELGSGNGGTVTAVVHTPTGIPMAKKVVFIDAKPEVRKRILRELQILHECQSSCIVGFHGACLSDIHIYMCMEYMDVGSLDTLYQRHGAITVDVCGKIVVSVVTGLSYLYEVHRIIHRDVKPSNILVNSKGEIKICDFGVSGELINSIADTFVGTSTPKLTREPERIQGDQYSIKSDVWSLGVTMIELAHGCFPFALEADEDSPRAGAHNRAAPAVRPVMQPMSILELLQHIVFEPPPQLHPDGGFPPAMVDFVNQCLKKDPVARPTPMDLVNHTYVRESKAKQVDLVAWVRSLGYG